MFLFQENNFMHTRKQPFLNAYIVAKEYSYFFNNLGIESYRETTRKSIVSWMITLNKHSWHLSMGASILRGNVGHRIPAGGQVHHQTGVDGN